MDINTIWFFLIGVLLSIYLYQSAYEFGVGMLIGTVGRNENGRRQIAQTIGPAWGLKELWLLGTAAAVFYAFPGWWAALTGAFGIIFWIILLAVIVRIIAVNLYLNADGGAARILRYTLFFCSVLIPLLLALVLANLIGGIPINDQFMYSGSLADIFSLPALAFALMSLAFCIYHGAVYLTSALDEPLWRYAYQKAFVWGRFSLVFAGMTTIAAVYQTDIFKRIFPSVLVLIALLSVVGSSYLLGQSYNRRAFSCNGATILITVAALFFALYPRLLVSTIDPAFTLTLDNVAVGSGNRLIGLLAVILLILGVIVWRRRSSRNPFRLS